MKPIDFCCVTWGDLQTRVTGRRRQVLLALQAQGPCTTRALAAACSADVLAIRPRVTELIQLGLVQLVPGGTRNHQGVYRALSLSEAEAVFGTRRRQSEATRSQLTSR